MDKDNPIYNASHKLDLTAHDAIENVYKKKDDDRYHKFLGCLYRIGELSGYYIEDIVVKDKRTGKLYSTNSNTR
jgi:hypothetical protein